MMCATIKLLVKSHTKRNAGRNPERLRLWTDKPVADDKPEDRETAGYNVRISGLGSLTRKLGFFA